MREIRPSGSMSGGVETEQGAAREAPATRKGRPTDRPHLNHRATLRLYTEPAGKIVVVRSLRDAGSATDRPHVMSPEAARWYSHAMYAVEIEQEVDGRWIAEVMDLPGVLVYGQTREEALARVQALALRVMAERVEQGEDVPEMVSVMFRAA